MYLTKNAIHSPYCVSHPRRSPPKKRIATPQDTPDGSYNKTRHLSATHLGIDNDSLRLSGLPNLKLGRKTRTSCSTRFQSNKSFISALAKLMRTPPQFLISSMKIRQQRLPIIKHGYSTFFGQTDISFQTIRFDTVQRAKQPIKKRSDT